MKTPPHKTDTEVCQCRIIHEERVAEARQLALSDERLHRLTSFSKALADPTRAKILWALTGQEMCVCDLAAFLGLSESAVSHQLRFLRTLDLVANRREGPVLYYRLAHEKIGRLLPFLLNFLEK